MQAWRLFTIHMQELDAVYRKSSTRGMVQQFVQPDGEHADLWFLYLQQREFFDAQYFSCCE